MNEINKEEFKKDIENYAKVLFRKSIKEANDQEKFQAVSYAVKDIVVDQWMATHKTYEEQDVKTVYYLSMEFLTGKMWQRLLRELMLLIQTYGYPWVSRMRYGQRESMI